MIQWFKTLISWVKDKYFLDSAQLYIGKVEFASPFILVINFKYKSTPYHVIIEGHYQDYYRREDINLDELPLVDIIKSTRKSWFCKSK